jgi:hypothetical protein
MDSSTGIRDTLRPCSANSSPILRAISAVARCFDATVTRTFISSPPFDLVSQILPGAP